MTEFADAETGTSYEAAIVAYLDEYETSANDTRKAEIKTAIANILARSYVQISEQTDDTYSTHIGRGAIRFCRICGSTILEWADARELHVQWHFPNLK